MHVWAPPLRFPQKTCVEGLRVLKQLSSQTWGGFRPSVSGRALREGPPAMACERTTSTLILNTSSCFYGTWLFPS